MTNLPAISTLNQQIGELTEKLHPATHDQVSKSIRTMLAAGLSLPSGMKAEEAPNIYNFALEGVATYGVSVATRKVIRGEYEINKAFIPTPPELAAIARAEARVIREDKARLMERLDAMSQSQPQERDPAMVERIKAKLRDFREQDAARRAMNTIPQEPMSDEKAEYYRKIMDIKDTRAPSAEQMAYRRKIIRDIEDVHAEERKAAE